MNNIKCVIFDLDGTLLDTEKYYRKYWPIACKHFGYEMTDEMALEIRSLGRPFAALYFKEKFGPDFDYYEVREYRRGLIQKALEEDGIQLKPGAIEILEFLKNKGIKRAIATANDIDRTVNYLTELGLIDYFDELCCATMVKEGKPSPDVYEFACEKVGFKGEECLAIEDSPNGIKSAHGAGCKAVMVPDQSEPDEELMKLIYARIDSLIDIKTLI